MTPSKSSTGAPARSSIRSPRSASPSGRSSCSRPTTGRWCGPAGTQPAEPTSVSELTATGEASGPCAAARGARSKAECACRPSSPGPAQVPAGQVMAAVASTLDLFPTLARSAGAALPRDRSYPGRDLTDLLRGTTDGHEREPRPFYLLLRSSTSGSTALARWKLFPPHHRLSRAGADQLVVRAYAEADGAAPPALARAGALRPEPRYRRDARRGGRAS